MALSYDNLHRSIRRVLIEPRKADQAADTLADEIARAILADQAAYMREYRDAKRKAAEGNLQP